jgi:hypothetical protein
MSEKCHFKIIPIPEPEPQVEHLCIYCGGNAVKCEGDMCDECVKELFEESA